MLSKIADFFWSILFFMGGLLFGAFILYLGLQELNTYNHWNEYQRVNGKVTKLYVYSKKHNSVQHGVAKTTISWRLGGEYNYTSYHGKIHLKSGEFESFSTQEDAELALSQHKVGEVIPVWFHPDTPDEPILAYQRPTLENSLYLLGFAGIVLLMFMGMMVGAIKDYRYDRTHPEEEQQ
jgi:hypothetical protein